MKPVLRVAAGILYDGGRALIARRKFGGSLPGMWEFPGGKIEPGERAESCLARELGEELGITALDMKLFDESYYEYGFKRVHLLAYAVNTYSGIPAALDHDEIRWTPVPDLELMFLAPADVPIARKLMCRWMAGGGSLRSFDL